jgi:hypothetical protein
MKFCIKCGRKLPDEAVFCSKCGLKQPDIPEDIDNSFTQNQTPVKPEQSFQPQTPFVMQQPFMPAPQVYNPPNMQGFYSPMQQPLQNIPQNSPPFFQAPYVPQQSFLPQEFENGEKRLNTTLFFVWSIILIFVLNPVGTPLSILSTLFAGMARATDATYEQARKNLEVSKVMCIVATFIDVLCVIAVVVFLIYSLRTGNTIMPSGSGTQV